MRLLSSGENEQAVSSQNPSRKVLVNCEAYLPGGYRDFLYQLLGQFNAPGRVKIVQQLTQILRMLENHYLHPRTLCEVGYGAGERLKLLQEKMDIACSFLGYDISPQALAICEGRHKA